MAIQINTGLVEQAAEAISAENSELRNAYQEIDKAVSSLHKCWSGSAAELCCKKAEYIKANYKDARYAVVADFVRFLRQQVSTGYDTMEKAVSSAADAFK